MPLIVVVEGQYLLTIRSIRLGTPTPIIEPNFNRHCGSVSHKGFTTIGNSLGSSPEE